MRLRPGALLRAALAVLLLALLWRLVDGGAAVRRLAGADAGLLAAAAAALVVQTLLSAWRWRLTAARLGLALRPAEALREYWLAQLVNQAVPGGVAGDAARALRQSGQAGLMASGQAVAFERLAGQLGLMAVMAAGFGGTLAVPGGLDWPLWVGGLWLAAGVAGLVLLAGVRRLAPGQAAAFRQAVGARGVRGVQAALSLGTASCNVAGFGLCAWAVGADLPAAGFVTLVPLVLMAMLVPLTIAGWGLREGAAAALFPLAGLAPAEGMAASLAFGLVMLGTAAPGLAGLVWPAPVPRA
ncbi:MAG: YbhN family protein [Gemmobacter sp.]